MAASTALGAERDCHKQNIDDIELQLIPHVTDSRLSDELWPLSCHQLRQLQHQCSCSCCCFTMQHPLCLSRGLNPHTPSSHQRYSLLHTRRGICCSLSRQPGCSSSHGLSRPFLQHKRDSSSVTARSSDTPTGSDSEYNNVSKEEVDATVKKLQQLNSIQRGYLDRQKSGKQDDQDNICCWAKEADGLPRTHTSRCAADSRL